MDVESKICTISLLIRVYMIKDSRAGNLSPIVSLSLILRLQSCYLKESSSANLFSQDSNKAQFRASFGIKESAVGKDFLSEKE